MERLVALVLDSADELVLIIGHVLRPSESELSYILAAEGRSECDIWYETTQEAAFATRRL